MTPAVAGLVANTLNSISCGVNAAKSVILTTFSTRGARGASVYLNSLAVVQVIALAAGESPRIILQVEAYNDKCVENRDNNRSSVFFWKPNFNKPAFR